MRWFRMYHGAPNDKKWIVIAHKSAQPIPLVLSVVWELMDRCAQATIRGDVTGFDAEECAAYLGVNENDVMAVYQALEGKKWIVGGELVSWSKRQPKREDNSKERTQKWREKKHTVTHGDAKERTVTPRREEKRRDSKKEIYKEKRFLEFYEKYPKHEAKGAARKAYRSALLKATHEEIIKGLGVASFSTDRKFIPLPATWLNAERWQDETRTTAPPVDYSNPEWWRKRFGDPDGPHWQAKWKAYFFNNWPSGNFPENCPKEILSEYFPEEIAA